MAVTFEQARLNTQDDIQAGIIDEFRKSSYLLDAITFDDSVSPGTGQSTLTYGYQRLITQPRAGFRAINTEYAPQEVQRDRVTVDLKVFGGRYDIDRVIADNVSALIDEITLQAEQKVKAAKALFHDTVINGDSAVNTLAFDGLDVAIAGSTTETGIAEISDLTAINDRNTALAFLRKFNRFLARLDGVPTAIMGNTDSITMLTSVAQYAGYMSQSEDAFGQIVDRYRNIPMVDLGEREGSNAPVVPTENRNVNGSPGIGLSDLYVARLGLDAFHGVSPAGRELVRQWLPDYTTAGAVKSGEVELVAAVALKRTKAAGVFRNVKVL